MYITAPEPTSTPYFMNSFHQFLCLRLYVARQRIRINVIAATNTHAKVKELLDSWFFFYAAHVVSKESRRLVLPRTSFLYLILRCGQSLRLYNVKWYSAV
jgi:hypothetical protein